MLTAQFDLDLRSSDAIVTQQVQAALLQACEHIVVTQPIPPLIATTAFAP
jgi:hypothetical protein